MERSCRLALAVFAAGCGLAVSVAGCGGSSSSSGAGTTNSGTTSTSATTTSTASVSTSEGAQPRYVRKTVRSGRSGPSGAIPLAGLGTLDYRCDTGGVSASLGGSVRATESVYVEGDARKHLRAGTVQPPARLAIAAVRDRELVWHIIQSTEASTLDGIVAVRFGVGAGAAACSPVRWTASVGVISHAGSWTAPRGWL